MDQTEINVFDKLLYYLSHEGEVSWTKFKVAIDRFTSDQRRFEYISTYLKYLARLGHLDFDPMQLSHVTIGPTVLLETAVNNRYVLVGSRTPGLLKEVENCVSDIGGKLRSELNKNAPATIIISDIDETETSFTEIKKLDINISLQFSAKLSQLLPKPKRSSFPPSDISLSDSRRMFNLKTLKFERYNQRQRSNGLYEIPHYGRNIYILKSGADQRRVPLDWGTWLALSDAGKTTGLVYYKKKTYRWYVKSPLQIPLILDRCATLCYGNPPVSVLKNKYYRYSYVHAGIANQLTKSLNQNWEKVNV